MAQITLARRNWRNGKANGGAGRPHGRAIKDKPKPGMFWIDQFTDWCMGFTSPDVAYPSRMPVERVKIPGRKK